MLLLTLLIGTVRLHVQQFINNVTYVLRNTLYATDNYYFRFLDQELISYRHSSCSSCCCWGDLFKKA